MRAVSSVLASAAGFSDPADNMSGSEDDIVEVIAPSELPDLKTKDDRESSVLHRVPELLQT